MRNLVKENSLVLKLKFNKRTKKNRDRARGCATIQSFLERKKAAKFDGLARFCVVTTEVERTIFSK